MKKGALIILIIIVGWFIYYVVGIIHGINEDIKNDAITTSIEIPKDYLKLFRSDSKLIADKTIISKRRNPISQFNYDDKFRINVYRVNIATDLSLSKIINETYENNHISYGLNYKGVDDIDKFEILCKFGFQDKGARIYLNVFGEGTRILRKNDSLVCYYSKIENFYIKYQLNAAQDFFGRIKEKYSDFKIPIEIMFIKKSGNVYLVLLTANDENTKLNPGTLLDLIANAKS